MSDSILREKSKGFAKQIVFACRKIKTEQHEAVLANQLLRCGASIGADIHEAHCAQGTKDFISYCFSIKRLVLLKNSIRSFDCGFASAQDDRTKHCMRSRIRSTRPGAPYSAVYGLFNTVFH